MNLDDYIAEISRHRQDPACAVLASMLELWKHDSSDVRALVNCVERYFGNSWIESDEVHGQLYAKWEGFKTAVVDPLGGKTMNERLYWFGLSRRHSECRSDQERELLYAKLGA